MKLKIVNHRKFRRRVILAIFIISFFIFNIKNTASSEAKIEYKTITVSTGDTLWDIAQNEKEENKFYENSDIREIITNIKKVNNLTSSNLKIEQKLKIPSKI